MKFRKTVCIDPDTIKVLKKCWGYQPIDLRKKKFVCIHCKKEHPVKTCVMLRDYDVL